MVKYFQNIATLQKPKEEKVFNHSCVCHGGYHIRRLMINHCYFPPPRTGQTHRKQSNRIKFEGVYNTFSFSLNQIDVTLWHELRRKWSYGFGWSCPFSILFLFLFFFLAVCNSSWIVRILVLIRKSHLQFCLNLNNCSIVIQNQFPF